jgi:hypothetical protein
MDRVEDSPTASRILAVRESRRQSVEAHQQQPELRLQKELNALKNYISDPSALDKVCQEVLRILNWVGSIFVLIFCT